jgi:hypothetical protein
MSPAAIGDISLTPGSHIWFGSLEFIIAKEGDDLDLVPPTNKPADFLEPVDDLRCRSDELRNTWPNKFSLPGLPQAARSHLNKKVRRPSTNAHHLSPKAGEVPKDLPQQLRHAIVDTLASTETSSNSDFEDNYDNSYQAAPASPNFRGCNAFCTSATTSSTTSRSMMISSIPSMAMSYHGHKRDNQAPT